MDPNRRIERALDGLAPGSELHAAVQSAVAEVQAELDAKDAKIAQLHRMMDGMDEARSLERRAAERELAARDQLLNHWQIQSEQQIAELTAWRAEAEAQITRLEMEAEQAGTELTKFRSDLVKVSREAADLEVALTDTGARMLDAEAERDRLAEIVAQVRALAEATTSALSAPPFECTNACFGGPCNCGKPFRAVAWNLDPAALLVILDAAPSPNGEPT